MVSVFAFMEGRRKNRTECCFHSDETGGLIAYALESAGDTGGMEVLLLLGEMLMARRNCDDRDGVEC